LNPVYFPLALGALIDRKDKDTLAKMYQQFSLVDGLRILVAEFKLFLQVGATKSMDNANLLKDCDRRKSR